MKENNKRSEVALREEKILEFWREHQIFEKSLEQTKRGKEFIFYEGPPTANAKPALHHLEARAFKDAIPRYKTMQGFYVRRKAGWDTHGLPVELQVEKKLGLQSKKEIEEYGIAKFNEECKKSVWEYVDLWEQFTDRIGFWLDKENPYVTYKNNYIESVWNIIAEANKQKLLFKDYKVVPWCPRCGTALSSHELAQGYETVKDLSVYVKFKIKGEGITYILAWTTTPWTLPGNLALAVGANVDYVKVLVGEEFYIIAKNRLSVVENYEIVSEMKGEDLVGLEYEPLFPFFTSSLEPSVLVPAYKVYAADFVTTEDGTGVVHTAVMYGQDDFELGTKVGLPKLHLVGLDGKFVVGTGFLEGHFVRDEETTVAIIKDLAQRNLLFKKEKYEHEYPFCWRCQTGLIYYARDSWYIRMSDKKIKNKLISENKKINWEPAHIRDGRFGEWLRDLKDWAISRERYWGTPLPVWLAEDGEKLVIGSTEELRKYSQKSGNKYFVMRHGEAENNIKNLVNNTNDNPSPLTERGQTLALRAGKSLRKDNIEIILASPLLRAQETAKIVADELGLSAKAIITDDRLIELQVGEFDDRPVSEYHDFFSGWEERFYRTPQGGENLSDLKRRMGGFIYNVEKKFSNKNILIVSHEDPVWMIELVAGGLDQQGSIKAWKSWSKPFINMGETRILEFVPLPHNDDYELDLHRPYIDDIVLVKNGKEFRRTKEVMDVWLDSGAMPFAQDHYPFSTKKILYPADYISEALDQTRGWFYTLHAVGVLMGKGLAYKNVICLGHLLDTKGKKMSKSLGNIVDPWEMTHKYGADTLRLWMYAVNQPGESKNFDEKTVLELQRQVFGLLYNVLAFYELYPTTLKLRGISRDKMQSNHVLDRWILVRLDELTELATENLEKYKLLEPVRAMKEFIGDLSTWYLRRSRERIKNDDAEAKQTLYYVLKTLAKLMAPFAPFAAEDIWQRLKGEQDAESVHLCTWPTAGKVNSGILENMRITREMVSLGLQARQKANIPVRQPLGELQVESEKLSSEYLELIKDELNVKKVTIGTEFKLSLEISPELALEGNYRELLRTVQDMRKKQGLTPNDEIILTVDEDARDLVQKFESELKKAVLATEIKIGESVQVEIAK